MKVKEWLEQEFVAAYVKMVQDSIKEKPIVCPKTGNFLNLKYNPLHDDRDYYITVRAA